MSRWTRRALPIGTGVLAAFLLRDAFDNRWATEPDVWLLISHVVATLVYAIATLWVYRVSRPSFRLLRGIELACVSAACAFMAAFQWGELREYAPSFLMNANPDRDLGIFESLNDSFSLRWGFMIAVYVILVPNPVKRSAVVACLIALIPIAMIFAFCRQYPVSWGFTAGLAFDSFLWSAAFAGVSLYALQIIDTTLRGTRVLGHYTLLEKIGEGGMGSVWKARHRSYVQFVALKFPSDRFVSDRTAMKRFRAEVEAMAAMNHPHLVRVYNFDPGSEGRPYFVMELLDGWTLDSIVRQYGALPASRAVYLVRQVCAALSEIHARGMVHRDVKPSNIMVCNYHTEYDFAKLLDLGVVHFPGASGSKSPAFDCGHAKLHVS